VSDADEETAFEPGERPTPGGAKWFEHLNMLREAPPSERRRELHRLSDGMRAVLHRLVQTSAPTEMLSQAADLLEALAAGFDEHPGASIYEGFAEAANSGDPFAFFDHSPMLGRANPLAPPLEMWSEGDRIFARATFDAAYEGPPGCVHGGYVAAAFDEILGSAQSMSGSPGMTGRLTVHYRSPTPLHAELIFEAWLSGVDGRKISTEGTLHADGRLCAEAEGLFISIDPARFAALKAQRDERLGRP
jgi:acyl-coenzyme A thioesterase PaaI-like protein